MSRRIGLYLHIPFCRSKCLYCDFPSYPGQEAQMEAVIGRMTEELWAWGKRLPDARVETVYLGGGTPSLLPPTLLERLLSAARDAFLIAPDAEISMEMNPGTITERLLQTAVRSGVNRVSIGAQSAQDRLLKLLGRIHDFAAVKRAVEQCRRAGIDNLNLDMMLGLPTQTLMDVEETLERLIALSPKQISCYGLIVEDGTRLKRLLDDGVLQLPDEDLERDMYELARSVLENAGYAQYEISNFAKPGFSCRHNVDCWQRKEYLGVGVAACGFLGTTRYRNPVTIPAYLAGEAPEITELTAEDERFESIMLGLRMTEGISDAEFCKRHGLSIRQAFGDKLDGPLQNGLLTFDEGVLRLTRRGMDVQNGVLVDLR